jgi:stage III sporulation protein SpoIIIAA
MLPTDVRDALMTHEHRNLLLEVVLDLGRCPEARFAGNLPNQCLRPDPVTQADLDAAEAAVGAVLVECS